MSFNSLIQGFQDVSGEIFTVVQFGQIINEFGTRHLSTDILAMQVGVKQHNSTSQCMDSICICLRIKLVVFFNETNLDKPWELYVPGLQSKYLLEKCTNTRSRSCVSPDSANCCKNCLKASSNVNFSKSKYFKYSSATARLKSLLQKENFI